MLKTRATYISCNDLPMQRFISVVVHGKLDALYIDKSSLFLKSADLKYIWERITDEFKVLSNDNSSNEMFSLIREYTYLTNRIAVIEAIIKFSKITYSFDTLQVLKAMGFRYSFTEQSYQNDLRLVQINLKTTLLKQISNGKQIKKLSENQKETTEDDYSKITVQLETQFKIPIDLNTCTVAKFMAYLKEVKNGKRTKD